MIVSGISLRLSTRPLRYSRTDLIDPGFGPFSPLVGGVSLAYTAWFQNPLETSNYIDPITVPSNEAISVVSVPADVTSVLVYYRRDGGPAKLLSALVDQTGGNWSVSGKELLPMDSPQHGNAPWEDIEFRAKFISPEGVTWHSAWTEVIVSHAAPTGLPGWTGGGPEWTWPGWGGGFLSDCLAAVGDHSAINGIDHPVSYGNLGDIDIRVDISADPFIDGLTTPPSTDGWEMGTNNAFIMGGGWSQTPGEYFEWMLYNGNMTVQVMQAVSNQTLVFPMSVYPAPERAQWRVHVNGTACEVFYRDPYNDVGDRLPLSNDTNWTSIGTDTFNFATDMVLEHMGVCQGSGDWVHPIAEHVGQFYGYYMNLEGDEYGVADPSLVNFGSPTAEPEDTWVYAGSRYDFTDDFGNDADLRMRDEDAVAGRDYCFSVTW